MSHQMSGDSHFVIFVNFFIQVVPELPSLAINELGFVAATVCDIDTEYHGRISRGVREICLACRVNHIGPNK